MNSISRLYKNAYGGLSQDTWWLSLVMLINRAGTMVLPFMTLYLTHEKHVSLGQAGFVMALFGAGAVCGGLIGGRLTDKFGFYPVQIATLSGGGIMFIVLGQINSFPLICVFTFLLSAINESFRPANSAAIAHYSKDDNRTRSYALNRLAINVGWAVGVTMGGIIASKNYQLLFWIDGISNIGAAILLWLVLSPAKNEATRTSMKKDALKTGDKYAAYKDKTYIAFTVLVMLFAYCFFQTFTTMPVFYKDELGLSEKTIGFVMAINGVLITLVEMILVFKLEGKKHALYFTTIGVALTGVSFMIMNVITGPMLLAISAMLVITAGEMLSMPFMNTFWISRSTPENRGQYAGLYTVAWATAQVLGPLTGAQIAERFGFQVLWWFIGGVCIVCAVGFKWLEKKTAGG